MQSLQKKPTVVPVLKIILPVTWVIAQSFLSHEKVNHWSICNEECGNNLLTYLEHITIYIYSCFAISGILDILSQYLQYPKETSQTFTTVALPVTSFLLFIHSNGQEVRIYLLHTYAILATTLLSALRILSAANLWVNIGFFLSLILQGTWFMETGYILYALRSWDKDVRGDVAFVTCCYTWHIVVVLCALILYLILSVATIPAPCTDEENKLLRKEETTTSEIV